MLQSEVDALLSLGSKLGEVKAGIEQKNGEIISLRTSYEQAKRDAENHWQEVLTLRTRVENLGGEIEGMHEDARSLQAVIERQNAVERELKARLAAIEADKSYIMSADCANDDKMLIGAITLDRDMIKQERDEQTAQIAALWDRFGQIRVHLKCDWESNPQKTNGFVDDLLNFADLSAAGRELLDRLAQTDVIEAQLDSAERGCLDGLAEIARLKPLADLVPELVEMIRSYEGSEPPLNEQGERDLKNLLARADEAMKEPAPQ